MDLLEDVVKMCRWCMPLGSNLSTQSGCCLDLLNANAVAQRCAHWWWWAECEWQLKTSQTTEQINRQKSSFHSTVSKQLTISPPASPQSPLPNAIDSESNITSRNVTSASHNDRTNFHPVESSPPEQNWQRHHHQLKSSFNRWNHHHHQHHQKLHNQVYCLTRRSSPGSLLQNITD